MIAIVFTSGHRVPHGAGRLRPTRHKSKARATSPQTSPQILKDRYDDQGDERIEWILANRCATLEQHLKDSELKSRRLHNILRYCVKFYLGVSSGRMDPVLHGLLEADAPDLLEQADHTSTVAVSLGPLASGETHRPRTEGGEPVEDIMQDKFAPTTTASALEGMPLEQLADEKDIAYLLQNDSALLGSVNADDIHNKDMSIDPSIQNLRDPSNQLQDLSCDPLNAENTGDALMWQGTPASDEHRMAVSTDWQSAIWYDPFCMLPDPLKGCGGSLGAQNTSSYELPSIENQ